MSGQDASSHHGLHASSLPWSRWAIPARRSALTEFQLKREPPFVQSSLESSCRWDRTSRGTGRKGIELSCKPLVAPREGDRQSHRRESMHMLTSSFATVSRSSAAANAMHANVAATTASGALRFARTRVPPNARTDKGEPAACSKLGFVGLSGNGGGLAEYFSSPEEYLHHLPDNVSLKTGSFSFPVPSMRA